MLDILFRRIEPEEVIAQLYRKKPRTLNELCMLEAESVLGGYSFEEKEDLFDAFLRHSSIRIGDDVPRQLGCLAEIAGDMLSAGKDGPVCRYEKTLQWRDAYLRMGQDLFTTAWLAKRSLKQLQSPRFSWPGVIAVDNNVLGVLSEGLAENHMHLAAGASTFALTWACLMNHPAAILKEHEDLQVLLQAHLSRGTSDIWSFKRRGIYAARLRLILFLRLRGEIGNARAAFDDFHRNYSWDEMMGRELNSEIDGVRYIYGVPFVQPDAYTSVCMDYAFTRRLSDQREEHSRLLAAERLFLYDCFRACFDPNCDTPLSAREQWVFYIYLLLKSHIRSELVQVNQQVGFRNFHDYDNRKALLWNEYPEYWNEDYRQTVNANIQEQGLSSMEGRLTPGSTALQNVKRIHEIDRASRFYDATDFSHRWRMSRWTVASGMKNEARQSSHFYVLHFPKESEPKQSKQHMLSPDCRHAEFRRNLRKKAIELAKALSNNDYLCERVRGIDACSFELRCRPEVFGNAFRFLRSFPVKHYRLYPISSHEPMLSVTYHVGEDFLDIADGLRAVDEAVRFLEMKRGERIGHATVLGVDPASHYETKNRQIIASKQELLDMCVWIYFRSGELGVEVPLILRQEILRRANALFYDIYRKRAQSGSISLEEYYYSMLLRGDNPYCYEKGGYTKARITDPYDMYSITEDQTVARLRRQENISELCFLYHFCFGAKEEGARTQTLEVSDDYIRLMGQLQKAMRRYVNDKGIRIECNPSSNVLIGTFGSYHKHPILSFYNEGLGGEHSDIQMHVSINTDDPGVFDTSLTFEYALLARALYEMKDDNGERLNSDRAIEDYLRRIVQMGHEQSFPSVNLK